MVFPSVSPPASSSESSAGENVSCSEDLGSIPSPTASRRIHPGTISGSGLGHGKIPQLYQMRVTRWLSLVEYTCVYICVYVYIYVCIYICMCVCVYIHIPTHMHIYICVYIYIHTHTYAYISPGEGHGNPLQHSCLGKSHGQRRLAGYSPWGRKESDTTEAS